MLLEVFDCNNFVRRVHEKDVSGLALRNLFTNAYHNPNPSIYVFDGKDGKEARRKIYPEYKANRTPADDKFYITLELFKMLVQCTNKLMICIDGWEADDVIATLCKTRPDGVKIQIWSNDGDYHALCDGDNIKMTDVPVKLKDIAKTDIRLYKTLVGDPSDNIKGIHLFGPKSWEAVEEKGLKQNWYKIFEERNMGHFQAADLHLTNSQWLWYRQNFKTLLAYWDIVNFINVPKELMDANTKVGTPDLAKANAILKTVFQ